MVNNVFLFILSLCHPIFFRQDHLPDEDGVDASGNGQDGHWPPFDRFDTFGDEHLGGSRKQSTWLEDKKQEKVLDQHKKF